MTLVQVVEDAVRAAAPDGRPMTRCECALVAFDSVAREMVRRRLSVAAAIEGSGCGRLCTACLPDLQRYLTRR